ncbi:AAEL006392-PA [Aedes aegypti]|uniref:AAEL006392-PA n=1 Tax=Aedes aegypti TaxID=7159 RepID=Q176F2_AEDAE|nr:AAEL006392-PA [Aedes aegypti]
MSNSAQTHQQYKEHFDVKPDYANGGISEEHLAAKDGRATGSSSPEHQHAKREEEFRSHYHNPYEGFTSQFTEHPAPNMSSLYGPMFGHNSVDSIQPYQSLPNTQPYFGYPPTNTNFSSPSYRPYGVTLRDCSNDVNWRNPGDESTRRATQKVAIHISGMGRHFPETNENQPIPFTSPYSNVVLYVSGLNHLEPNPPRIPSVVEPTVEIVELPSDSELEAESVNFCPQSTVATFNGTARKKLRRGIKNTSLYKPPVISEWKCIPCNRMFRNKGGLLQHKNTHHSGERPFVCKVCGKRFHEEPKKQQHENRHAVTDKPFKCSSCPRQYLHQYDLKRHADLHHKDATFTCKYCGKGFDRHDHVRDHETSHENGTAKRPRKNLNLVKKDEE